MEAKRLETLDNRFSDYLAQMLCVRPSIWVQTRGARTLVKYDPPPRDALNVVCRACNAPLRGAEHGRLLCSKCRSKPSVLQGPPLIHTMYWGSHPRFALNADMVRVVAHIRTMCQIASRDMKISEHLAYKLWQVFQRGSAGMGGMNIFFPEEEVKASGAYDAPITACNPRYTGDCRLSPMRESFGRHDAVTVGGLGEKLQQLVKRSVKDWLDNLDAMIRRRFSIPLEQQHGDTSIATVIGRFAKLIADRVVHLEVRGENPTKYLCAIAFQHVIRLENVRCEHHAKEHASADIRSMQELVRLAQGGALLLPERRARLVAFLRSPCPELLKFLPQVAQQYEFEQLIAALDLFYTDPPAASEQLDRWRGVYAGSLVEVLNKAIEKTREWRPVDFLPCVQRHDTPRHARLPAMGWDDNPFVASWSLVSSATYAHRRTGLDPTGMRIVLMASALWSLSADERFFRPGFVRCDLEDVMRMVGEHGMRATHAHRALKEQLMPYMIGEPWRVACEELTNWQGSHIEDDVRRAGSLLGDFSMTELYSRYGRDPGEAVVQMVQQKELHTALMHSTSTKMVFKPASQYEDWFPLAVDLLLPILAQLRQTMGIAAAAPSSKIGDILRLLPSVRNWNPEDGALRLGLVEVKNKPTVKELLKKLEAEKSPLAKMRRVNTVNVWELDVGALAKVLGK